MKKIEIGVGVNKLVFGMTREQALKVVGEPTEKEELFLDEEENDMLETWHFDALDMSLGFEEEEDFKLITVSITSKDYTLFGESIMGKTPDFLIDLLEKNNIENADLEEADDVSVLYLDDQSMKFWIEDNFITEIQFGPLFKDEETIAWPKF